MDYENESKIKRLQNIIKHAVSQFSAEDWALIAMTLPYGHLVTDHNRLLRSCNFGDEDYAFCAGEVLGNLIEADKENLERLEDICGLHPVAEMDESRESVKTGSIEVFISHKAEDRNLASAMKAQLEVYGIKGFVAHEDIEVTSMWELEIEKSLRECDAFIYIATDVANASTWCQQEIGWALGRGIPMLGVSCGSMPIGFFGNRQACRRPGPNMSLAAKELVSIVLENESLSPRLIDSVIGQLCNARSYDSASRCADLIEKSAVISNEQAKMIEKAIHTNDQVADSNFGKLPERLHEILETKISGYQVVPLDRDWLLPRERHLINLIEDQHGATASQLAALTRMSVQYVEKLLDGLKDRNLLITSAPGTSGETIWYKRLD